MTDHTSCAIRPGKPADNAYVESFNGKFRDECLNEHWFTGVDDAREQIERWRTDYNTVRPHSSLGNFTLSGRGVPRAAVLEDSSGSATGSARFSLTPTHC